MPRATALLGKGFFMVSFCFFGGWRAAFFFFPFPNGGESL
jgi:hypothetical protein